MTRARMDDVLEHLARRGLSEPEMAMRALRATVAVLGERLVHDEATALAEALPLELAPIVANLEYDGDFGTADLYDRVRRREQTAFARAKEHVEIVLATLGECLDHDVRTRLARALPTEAGELLLERTELGEPPPYRAPPRAPRSSTLAAGRPASTRPLSEAAPPSGQSHSVARDADPHADTKLSSSRGLTQERLHETLAESRGKGR